MTWKKQPVWLSVVDGTVLDLEAQACRGLAITRALSWGFFVPDHWRITHISTGKTISTHDREEFPSIGAAKIVAEKLLQLGLDFYQVKAKRDFYGYSKQVRKIFKESVAQ